MHLPEVNGSCFSSADTFHINPQFVIKLDEEDDEHHGGEKGCSFVLGLIQKNRRKLRQQGEDMNTIGFAIYEVSAENSKGLTVQNRPQTQFSNKRFHLFLSFSASTAGEN